MHIQLRPIPDLMMEVRPEPTVLFNMMCVKIFEILCSYVSFSSITYLRHTPFWLFVSFLVLTKAGA